MPTPPPLLSPKTLLFGHASIIFFLFSCWLRRWLLLQFVARAIFSRLPLGGGGTIIVVLLAAPSLLLLLFCLNCFTTSAPSPLTSSSSSSSSSFAMTADFRSPSRRRKFGSFSNNHLMALKVCTACRSYSFSKLGRMSSGVL